MLGQAGVLEPFGQAAGADMMSLTQIDQVRAVVVAGTEFARIGLVLERPRDARVR